MSGTDALLIKTLKVIDSCEDENQLLSAYRYAKLAERRQLSISHYGHIDSLLFGYAVSFYYEKKCKKLGAVSIPSRFRVFIHV